MTFRTSTTTITTTTTTTITTSAFPSCTLITQTICRPTLMALGGSETRRSTKAGTKASTKASTKARTMTNINTSNAPYPTAQFTGNGSAIAHGTGKAPPNPTSSSSSETSRVRVTAAKPSKPSVYPPIYNGASTLTKITTYHLMLLVFLVGIICNPV